jgi:hypothetical protein
MMLQITPITPEQIRDRAEIVFDKARKSFRAFRLAMHPEMIVDWWPQQVAKHLRRF